MNGETIAMIKALQNKSIEELKTSGGTADAGKVLTVGNDGRIAPIDLPVGEGEIALDGTLTIHGAAADAKKTGDALASLNGSLGDLSDGYASLDADKFAQATLNSDGSLDYTKKYDASTIEAFSFSYPVKIIVKDGYKMRTLLEKQDGTFLDSGFATAPRYVVPEQNIKLQIRKDPLTYGNADINIFARQVLFIHKDKEQLIRNTAQIDYLRSGNELIDAFFVRGGMAQGKAQPTVVYRAYTPNMIRYDRNITIVAQDGFMFGLNYFDENGVFTKDIGWKTSYSVPTEQNFKIVVARTTEDTSEMADAYYFSQQICIQTKLRDYIDAATKKDKSANTALNSPIFGAGRAKLVAHMGYHVGVPENSTASFIAAGRKGYWGIESDVQQTSDGYYVMCHDGTVDRTTDGTGNIANMTLAEIRELHLKGDSSLTIPTFEEYLAICKWYGCIPMIEFKGTITNTPESYTKIINIVKNMGLGVDSVVFTGSKWALDNFRKADETYIYGISCQQSSDVWDTELNRAKNYKLTMIAWSLSLGLTAKQITQAHASGIPICAFITDTVEATMGAFEIGADCCTTNIVTPTD